MWWRLFIRVPVIVQVQWSLHIWFALSVVFCKFSIRNIYLCFLLCQENFCAVFLSMNCYTSWIGTHYGILYTLCWRNLNFSISLSLWSMPTSKCFPNSHFFPVLHLSLHTSTASDQTACFWHYWSRWIYPKLFTFMDWGETAFCFNNCLCIFIE